MYDHMTHLPMHINILGYYYSEKVVSSFMQVVSIQKPERTSSCVTLFKFQVRSLLNLLNHFDQNQVDSQDHHSTY